MTMYSPTTYELDGEQVRLDWQPRFDPLSIENYRMATALFPAKETLPFRNRIWTKPVVLNQNTYRCPICGQFGACTGYAVAQICATTPRRTLPAAGSNLSWDIIAHKIYHEAKKRDQWTGESYEGSSVLGACQYLKEADIFRDYFWAKTVEEIARGVGYYGPMNVGIDWTEDMFYPDSNNEIHATGADAGGHSIEVIGVAAARRKFILPNTWGSRWAKNGTVEMSWDTMEALIERRGEFALPRKTWPKSGGLVLP